MIYYCTCGHILDSSEHTCLQYGATQLSGDRELELLRRIEKYTYALRFYANPENYKFRAIDLSTVKPGETVFYPPNIAWEDQGKIAREALDYYLSTGELVESQYGTLMKRTSGG